jgi:hypothetical protein
MSALPRFSPRGLAAALTTFFAAAEAGLAQTPPKRILFVIGGSNSAGFRENGTLAERDEHRSMIDNVSTATGNHGWGELANALGEAGYLTEQVAEGGGAGSGTNLWHSGTALPFDTMDLAPYAAIVLGSNNASYAAAQVDAIERFVRGGGGLLLISDANFGAIWNDNANTTWQDASNSDQQFADRFGLRMNQDRGTYEASRASDHFLVPDHPLLTNVDGIHGEGVTPVSLGSPVAGVHSQVIVRVPSQFTLRENLPPFDNAGLGDTRNSTAADGVVVTALAGGGRVVGHFDRNTFFNDGGGGSDIHRSDNLQFALNLFAWLAAGADLPPPANGWEAYRRRHFHELDRADPAISGPDADPDGDRLENWREALHGLNPHVADHGGPLSYFHDVAANQVRWRFRRGDSWDGASLRLARSADLAVWTAFTPAEQLTVAPADGGEWIEYRIDTAPGREFWRFEFDAAALPPP